MGNRKYRKPIDRYHPPTPLENKNTSSRTARRQSGKGTAMKREQNAGTSRGGRLLSVLFFVFIFLPVFAVFLYVAVIYSPEEEKQISISSSNEVSFQENAEPITPLLIPEEETEEKDSGTSAAEPAETATESLVVTEEKTAADPENRHEEAEAADMEEEAVPEKPAEPEPETEQPPALEQIHTVQKGETLYRIAISYYGTSGAVDQIMQANGMSTPDLSIGETLILPD